MGEEKIKIESVNNYINKLKKAMIICIVIAIIGLLLFVQGQSNNRKYWRLAYNEEYLSEEYYEYSNKIDFYYGVTNLGAGVGITFSVASVVLIIFYFYTRKMKIVVTDKRVYGQTAFGKQVDLPFDSISAISKSIFKGIAVATSSGRIRFLLISNNEEIYKTISDLLIARQQTRQDKIQEPINNTSTAEELKQYKELLDSGVITQEEFEAKKKQLLGL